MTEMAQWFSAARRVLPGGAHLRDNDWTLRHRGIGAMAFAASVALASGVGLTGAPLVSALLCGGVPLGLAVLGWLAPARRRLRAALSSTALIVAALIAIHLSGAVESQFLLFILVPIIALYEDWAPLALAALLVVLGPGVLGILLPDFSGPGAASMAAHTAPAVLGPLFALMCVTSLIPLTALARSRVAERVRLGRLESQALHDPLTGLANRTLLADRMRDASEAARATGESILVISVDLDGFKPVNDSFGHAAGDALLVESARRLRGCLRPGDTAARTGGDEFTLLLPCADHIAAADVARRILDALVVPFRVNASELRISASLGLAYGTGLDLPEDLVSQADTAMYAAKHAGRGRFVIYDEARRRDVHGSMDVNPDDARQWAAYMDEFRAEIAAAKSKGLLPEQTRGPETVRRTLESLLAAIRQLPPGPGTARLALPQATALEEFAFHSGLVLQWADSLVAQGIVAARMSPGAESFWSGLHDAVTRQGMSGGDGIPGQQSAEPPGPTRWENAR